MKGQTFPRRLGFAVSGWRLALRLEPSFRFQAAAAVAAFIVLAIFRPSLVWWALVCLAAACVLAAELFNAAIEQLSDHLHPERHPAIRAVKDLAAGAVLVACLGAIAVGLLLLLSLYLEGRRS